MIKTLYPKHDGISVPITYNSLGHIKEVEKHGKFFEYGMLEAISKLPYRPGICMDIGANVGNHTVFFSKFCKFDKVWAFEPSPNSFILLERNIIDTVCENVLYDNCAIGCEPGFISMTNNDTNPSWNEINGKGDILIIPIDTNKKVSLMKIDVEGYELEVVKGAYEVIEREKPELFIETHGKPEDLLRSLPKGYRLIKRYNNSPTYHFSDSADFFIKDVL